MSTEQPTASTGRAGRSRQAWAQFADAFADIGRQFRNDYEQASEATSEGTEKAQKSLERAVTGVRTAVETTAKTISESLRDPKVREETEEAGAALLRAVGVSLSELGDVLKRRADSEPERAD